LLSSSSEIRVGVNTGEVVIRPLSTSEGHVEYTPIGRTTNLARMQAIARSASILASEHTQRLIEGYFQTRALGPVQIKGLALPVNVFEVAGLGSLRTRLQDAKDGCRPSDAIEASQGQARPISRPWSRTGENPPYGI
jgi:class 3 adenylate cyclase